MQISRASFTPVNLIIVILLGAVLYLIVSGEKGFAGLGYLLLGVVLLFAAWSARKQQLANLRIVRWLFVVGILFLLSGAVSLWLEPIAPCNAIDTALRFSGCTARLKTDAYGREYVWSMAIAPDGKTLAVASDSTMRMWNLETRTVARTEYSGSSSVAFAPDGSKLAAGVAEKVLVWQAADGKLLLTLQGHKESVPSLAFSPDGSLLASGSKDKTVRLWRVADGAMVRALEGHTAEVRDLAFAPDGSLLASVGFQDPIVRVWKVADGSVARTLELKNETPTSVAFSPDGKFLATGAWEGIRLWRVADGGLVFQRGKNETDRVNTIAFSPDGAMLASAGPSAPPFAVRVWRASDGTWLRTLETYEFDTRKIAFARDGTLAVAAWFNVVQLWAVK